MGKNAGSGSVETQAAQPATVENLDFPHKNISGWLKILTSGWQGPGSCGPGAERRRLDTLRALEVCAAAQQSQRCSPEAPQDRGEGGSSTAQPWGFGMHLSSPAVISSPG